MVAFIVIGNSFRFVYEQIDCFETSSFFPWLDTFETHIIKKR